MSTNTFSKARVSYPLVEEARAYADTNGLPIYNIAIGVTNPDPNYKISRQNSSCYTFEYVLEGKGEIVIDGKKLAVNKGDTYILFKGGNHTYRSLPESPMKKYWINFNCDYLSEMLNSYNLTEGVYKIDTLSAFENLLFTSKSDLPFSKLYSTIADSIHNVIVCAALSLKADVNINANLLKEKLLASIYKKPSLKQIASDLNMSESNLIRTFKKHLVINLSRE